MYKLISKYTHFYLALHNLDGSIGTGAIIGIVIATIVVIVIIAAAGCYLYKKKSGTRSINVVSVGGDGGHLNIEN